MKTTKEQREKAKAYFQKNKEKIAAKAKVYYQKNKEKIVAKNREWREANKESLYIKNGEWRKVNKEKVLEWRKVNKESENKRAKTWRKNNKTKNNKTKNNYEKNRKKNDPVYKFKHATIKSIIGALKRRGFSKTARTASILGCDYETFFNHISEQFAPGMTIANHGLWELDHITPIASAQTESEVLKLNHYTNFQPLWADDNRAKSDTMPEQWEKIKAAS